MSNAFDHARAALRKARSVAVLTLRRERHPHLPQQRRLLEELPLRRPRHARRLRARPQTRLGILRSPSPGHEPREAQRRPPGAGGNRTPSRNLHPDHPEHRRPPHPRRLKERHLPPRRYLENPLHPLQLLADRPRTPRRPPAVLQMRSHAETRRSLVRRATPRRSHRSRHPSSARSRCLHCGRNLRAGLPRRRADPAGRSTGSKSHRNQPRSYGLFRGRELVAERPERRNPSVAPVTEDSAGSSTQGLERFLSCSTTIMSTEGDFHAKQNHHHAHADAANSAATHRNTHPNPAHG